MTPADSQGQKEAGQLYGAEYYQKGCGPVPYTRSEPQWPAFFGGVAEQLIRALQPKRVLDVGCALGFLVEAFWDRGLEAWGIDVSPYAIGQVRRDMQPYCRVASAAETIEDRYDLITCIEVLEHMAEDEATRGIENMTRATDTILFSSTPYDLDEPTHFNVRPILSWLTLFQRFGFSPDLDFDASFLCDHAMLLRRRADPLPGEVLRLFSHYVRQRHEIAIRQTRINEQTLSAQQRDAQLDALLREKAVLQQHLATAQAAAESAGKFLREKDALQVQLAGAQSELAEAGAMQDRIGEQLRAAHLELDQLLDSRNSHLHAIQELTATIRNQDAGIQSLALRIAAVEKQGTELSHGLSGILQSRIWRTLVQGGGLLQKITGR